MPRPSDQAPAATALAPDFPAALLEPAEMARADQIAMAQVPSGTLMERAGAAIARAAMRRVASGARVLVLCGPGNNGGDGYVAARLLAAAGCRIDVASLVPRDRLKGDAAAAAAAWGGDVVPLEEASFDDVGLVIDALFGAGLARDIDGHAAAAIAGANAWREATGCPVLAVDIPSGIDGATGAARGVAAEADATVTFFRLKPGHVLLPGRTHCGAVELADIGIPAAVLAEIAPLTSLITPRAWLADMPVPSLAGHKYSRGHAVVVCGPMAQTGAARLAARGALRVGAGLVTVATPGDALPILAAALTAIMTRVAEGAPGLAEILADARKNAVVMGPGLGTGEATRALVHAALAATDADAPPRAIVLDADALTSFAGRPDDLFAAIAASGHAVVLTPHDGEFAKLFGPTVDADDAKPKRVRAAASASGAIVVLKGPDTVIAHPDGHAAIAMSDAPWLATAGSGDVLAGMIGGLMAQAMPAFEAAQAAVWMHAEAARRFGIGLISEDIPDALPPVWRDLSAAKAASRR